MKDIFYPFHWLPYVWILLQAYLMLSLALFFLRRTKMLMNPIAGMEYGNVAVAASTLLSVLFIATAPIPDLFQAAKTLQYNDDHILKNIFLQFTEYFIVEVLAVGIFLIAAICNQLFLFKTQGDANANDGNIALGILMVSVNIGFAIVLWFWLKELSERITPEFVNFR